jgi:hypothetical protein
MRGLILTLLFVCALAAACGSPYTYRSYEVIRQADRLQAGDDVRVVPLEGESYQGRLVGIEEGRVTVLLAGDRERSILWPEIRIIERVAEVRGR